MYIVYRDKSPTPITSWELKMQHIKDFCCTHTRGVRYFLSLVFFPQILIRDLFHLVTVNCTFYLTFDKIQYFVHTARFYITIPCFTAILTRTKQFRKPGMYSRLNLNVAQTTSFEKVSSEFSILCLRRYYVDGFNNSTISISDNKRYGGPISAVIKTNIFFT